MAFYALFFLGLFLLACLSFPPSQRILGLSVAVAVVLYSFLKRWSILCHFFLGGLYALLPIVGSLWQTNEVTVPSMFFAVAAFCVVSGCDILYALQDEQIDRRLGLYSLPVKIGSAKAIEVSSSIHAIAFVCVTQGLFYAHVNVLGYVVWGIGAAFMLAKWHQIWTGRVRQIGEVFPVLLIGFSFSVIVSLVLDCAWKTLL
jgi:4-hydroxybenzoate polyprenyltransferase